MAQISPKRIPSSSSSSVKSVQSVAQFFSRPPAVWYLRPMTHRATAVMLIQTALLGFGLPGLSGCAAEVVTNNPGAQTPSSASLLSNAPAHADEGVRAPVPGQKVVRNVIRVTNALTGFVAGSLPDVVWAGFHTNGRTTNIWEFKQLPAGWPKTPPVLRWDTNNLMWGRKGMTAICQICEGMGAFGQGSLTALTRRHAYLRGHGMGASGLHPEKTGIPCWFCTRDNQVIEMKAQMVFTRGPDIRGQPDFSLVIFDADLPPSIEPMRVVDSLKLIMKYLAGDRSRRPVFMPLQGGYVSASVEGWTVPIRGGDSGAPLMLPLPDELVFYGGITTSAPSLGMQADMDMLSRQAGLDPSKYQMQWLNLDSYPNP
jgi:hypothetical protein